MDGCTNRNKEVQKQKPHHRIRNRTTQKSRELGDVGAEGITAPSRIFFHRELGAEMFLTVIFDRFFYGGHDGFLLF